jgi:hypothetical protein
MTNWQAETPHRNPAGSWFWTGLTTDAMAYFLSVIAMALQYP